MTEFMFFKCTHRFGKHSWWCGSSCTLCSAGMQRTRSATFQSGYRPCYLHPVGLVLPDHRVPVRWSKHITLYMSPRHGTIHVNGALGLQTYLNWMLLGGLSGAVQMAWTCVFLESLVWLTADPFKKKLYWPEMMYQRLSHDLSHPVTSLCCLF